jgi:hypothetical protein
MKLEYLPNCRTKKKAKDKCPKATKYLKQFNGYLCLDKTAARIIGGK